MELGYARVATTEQDLERQIDDLTAAGIAEDRIYVDRRSGTASDRPALTALLESAGEGDVVTVHTLDRLGRTVRDTLNLIADLRERGVGIRSLADPIRIDSSHPDDPMAQLAAGMLAMFGQMERTYATERASHARSVATVKGRRTGRPSVVNAAQLTYATELRDDGATISEIVGKTGLTRSTLYRHLPPRTPEQVTASGTGSAETLPIPTLFDEPVIPATPTDPLVCPTCGHRPTDRRDLIPHHHDLETIWLHLEDEELHEQRHCARCQPHESVRAVSCGRCGDGPLVTGAAFGDDLLDPVRVWLEGQGWTTNPDLVCANHRT